MSNRPGAIQKFGNARLQLVGDPQDLTDAVNKNFIRYDWPTGCVGKPNASEIFPYLTVPVAFTLPANLTDSIARTITTATSNTTFNLYRIPSGSSSASSIATLTFAAGASLGTFTMGSALNLSRGDILYWVAPSTQDSTLSDFGILVAGRR